MAEHEDPRVVAVRERDSETLSLAMEAIVPLRALAGRTHIAPHRRSSIRSALSALEAEATAIRHRWEDS